jgi:hypothetical protein
MQNNIILAAALTVLSAPVFAQAGDRDAFGLGEPVALESLSELRGGTDITTNDMRLEGATTGNTATAVQTGQNTITDGAFTNLSGIPMVIQNTGANVLIQNALIVNVQMR